MSTTLDIVRIPVLNDNYVWLMREPQSGAVGVVDPAVAGAVLVEAEKRRWKITHILNTHHHGDHVGGNLEIKKATGCTIVGLRRDRARIPGIDVEVDDGDRYRFGEQRRDEMVVILERHGYDILCKDVCDQGLPFEIWAVCPTLVDMARAEHFRRSNPTEWREFFK